MHISQTTSMRLSIHSPLHDSMMQEGNLEDCPSRNTKYESINEWGEADSPIKSPKSKDGTISKKRIIFKNPNTSVESKESRRSQPEFIKISPKHALLMKEGEVDILAFKLNKPSKDQTCLSLDVSNSDVDEDFEDGPRIVLNKKTLPNYRRKSCLCSWCGGTAKFEKKIQNHPAFQHSPIVKRIALKKTTPLAGDTVVPKENSQSSKFKGAAKNIIQKSSVTTEGIPGSNKVAKVTPASGEEKPESQTAQSTNQEVKKNKRDETRLTHNAVEGKIEEKNKGHKGISKTANLWSARESPIILEKTKSKKVKVLNKTLGSLEKNWNHFILTKQKGCSSPKTILQKKQTIESDQATMNSVKPWNENLSKVRVIGALPMSASSIRNFSLVEDKSPYIDPLNTQKKPKSRQKRKHLFSLCCTPKQIREVYCHNNTAQIKIQPATRPQTFCGSPSMSTSPKNQNLSILLGLDNPRVSTTPLNLNPREKQKIEIKRKEGNIFKHKIELLQIGSFEAFSKSGSPEEFSAKGVYPYTMPFRSAKVQLFDSATNNI